MSVLIKGMEMPSHCGECGIEWCDKWKKLIIAGMPSAKSRPDDCPLIAIPPHGRLIDSYALEDELGHFCEDYSVFNTVWHAPTIIEAEVEE